MQLLALVALLPMAFVAAAPTSVEERQVASGCYPFEDPDCGIDYAVCQCANGWFYEFDIDASNGNYCNPPWGFLATSEAQLGGYSC
ncbi:hypothetical protein TMatcc_011259 [Talaromyces marneffei ATCC 18224]|uniref:uncharacterized protein n=1 Tax=Talaromyces marneffei TaxID=37727 RepID=UPI0012A8F52B|nr:uncharacterized protein EYB26_010059 [Talaromyces marneffei]KAE8549010.1 hypothetical protein EYB25_009393 [Talaromyces marneffei]QGA22343.1 hypothetical protein EYB26_010059 [Talaromyces marneffei]